MNDNSGAIVTVDKGRFIPIKFEDIIDENGRISTREVDTFGRLPGCEEVYDQLEKGDFDELQECCTSCFDRKYENR
ncbi:MAG: hypothetical protein R3A12_04930 [Ignavibacteria bacterium]